MCGLPVTSLGSRVPGSHSCRAGGNSRSSSAWDSLTLWPQSLVLNQSIVSQLLHRHSSLAKPPFCSEKAPVAPEPTAPNLERTGMKDTWDTLCRMTGPSPFSLSLSLHICLVERTCPSSDSWLSTPGCVSTTPGALRTDMDCDYFLLLCLGSPEPPLPSSRDG